MKKLFVVVVKTKVSKFVLYLCSGSAVWQLFFTSRRIQIKVAEIYHMESSIFAFVLYFSHYV